MHPILQEYTQRFSTSNSYKIDQFYTQYDINEYHRKLPYIFDIESFCIRLYLAKLLGQKICIYSDYDTDAVTATATMYHGLLSLGFRQDKLDFYAPDRFVEGYGMNPSAVLDLAKKFDLIISVDCGINSTQEAETIKKLKVEKESSCDLIITDHHHLHGDIPDCVGVINPRLADYYSKAQDYQNRHEHKEFMENWQLLDVFKDDEILKNKIEIWLKKVVRKPEEVLNSPNSFLSQSVTGVGVAWFCLVWLGYFLQEVEEAAIL